MKRDDLISLAIFVIVCTYLLMGALAFNYLDSDTGFGQGCKFRNLLETLPHRAEPKCVLASTLNFASLILAMAGIGNSAATTYAGKIFCAIYGMCALPIGLAIVLDLFCRMQIFCVKMMAYVADLLDFLPIEPPEEIMYAVSAFFTISVLHTVIKFVSETNWDVVDSMYIDLTVTALLVVLGRNTVRNITIDPE